MRQFLLFFIVSVLLVVSGCKQEGEMSKEEIKTRASDVVVEYARVKEDKDFVVKNVEFSTATNSEIVFVEGHYKSDEKKEIVYMVDYRDDYKIEGIGSN